MNDLKGRCCRNTKRFKDHQTTIFDIFIKQLLRYYKWFANFCKSSWDEIKKLDSWGGKIVFNFIWEDNGSGNSS